MNPFSIFGDASTGQISNLPKAAQEHLIKIQFHNQSQVLADTYSNASYSYIEGYMTNEFTYSSTGNYKNIFENNFTNNVLTRALSDETQRDMMNYGYMTKKMYSNGESPILNVEFICYAGDDTVSTTIGDDSLGANNPVAIAQMLINATLPKVPETNAMLSQSLIDTASNVATAGGIFIGKAGLAIGDSITTSGSNFSKDMFTAFKGALDNFSSHKPPVCKLTIGNIFKKDMMVVKRVEVTFSKEFLRPGVPLHGKYNVTFESLYNATNITNVTDYNKNSIFGSGLVVNNKALESRVSFED